MRKIMPKVYALVYVDHEGLNLLELGDKDFIFDKYNEYTQKAEEFLSIWKTKIYNYEEMPDEYYDNPLHRFYEVERFCIQGYNSENEIGCVCRDFGLKLENPILY
jgi:hypothetical protein